MHDRFGRTTIFFSQGYIFDIKDGVLYFEKYRKADVAQYRTDVICELIRELNRYIPLRMLRDMSYDTVVIHEKAHKQKIVVQMDGETQIIGSLKTQMRKGRCFWVLDVMDGKYTNHMIFKNDYNLAELWNMLKKPVSQCKKEEKDERKLETSSELSLASS